MRPPVRRSTAAATHRRTAGRYWRLADIAEKEGRIARAREFVQIAIKLDRRAAEATDGGVWSRTAERSRIKGVFDGPSQAGGRGGRHATIAGTPQPAGGPAE